MGRAETSAQSPGDPTVPEVARGLQQHLRTGDRGHGRNGLGPWTGDRGDMEAASLCVEL